MDLKRIEQAMAPNGADGRRKNALRDRKDAPAILADLLLRKRTAPQVADQIGCHVNSVHRFRSEYLDDRVAKAIIIESDLTFNETLDSEIIDKAASINGAMKTITERREKIYDRVARILEDCTDQEFMGQLGAILKILNDQSRDLERATKIFETLERTGSTVPLSQHPDAAPLIDCLCDLFDAMPEAEEKFRQIRQRRKLILDV